MKLQCGSGNLVQKCGLGLFATDGAASANSQKRSDSLMLAQTLVYEFDFTIAASAGVRYFFGLVCRLAEDH